MVAAIEGVDVILAVDPDRRAIAEHDLVWDLRPALLDLERPLAAAERHGHRVSPDLDRGIVNASPAASKSAQLTSCSGSKKARRGEPQAASVAGPAFQFQGSNSARREAG